MPENYVIEDLYQGGYSSLNPDNGGGLFTGYRASVGSLGLSGDPRTANILKDLSDKIAPGIKTFELSLINPEIMETIPKQHLKEVNRISKLTGVDVTVHGPLIDASGVGERGFSDQERVIAERKIAYALDKSHEINPNGNVPVTFHTANALPAARYSKKEGKEITEMIPIVNQETGEVSIIRRDERISPILTKEGEIKKEMYEVDKKLEIMNNSQWDESLQQLIIPKEHADRILTETAPFIVPILKDIREGKIDPKRLEPQQKAIFNQYYSRFQNAHEQLEDIQKHLVSQFEKAYKYGTDKDKEYLKGVAENFTKKTMIEFKGKRFPNPDPVAYSEGLQGFMEDLRPRIGKFNAPPLFKDAGEYASEKSQETFGNAAWNAYKKFGEKAPILNIENPPAGMALSRAKDVRKMIEGSREQFIKNATENGMSKSQAEKQAEKLIGATWDVGHINELRQFGFTGGDILKEAEEIAPFVKHIHLADNFGMHTTVEMPMGMGNVDIKGVMKKLGKKGEEAKKIIEAGNWWQHHSNQGAFSPIGPTLEALGSPIYSMHMSPYWNQVAGMQEGYFSGLGQTFPPINYETFGAGFSNLPAELGGQRQGAQGSRMSGRGME